MSVYIIDIFMLRACSEHFTHDELIINSITVVYLAKYSLPVEPSSSHNSLMVALMAATHCTDSYINFMVINLSFQIVLKQKCQQLRFQTTSQSHLQVDTHDTVMYITIQHNSHSLLSAIWLDLLVHEVLHPPKSST